MDTSDPARQKKLGRLVKNFDEKVWNEQAIDIVKMGCFEKFNQNPEFKKKLLATGNRRIAEASPYDKIWGIGLGENDAAALDPDKWQGKNWLGIVLMHVRDRLPK